MVKESETASLLRERSSAFDRLAAVRRDKEAVLKELGMCGYAHEVWCARSVVWGASQSRSVLGLRGRSSAFDRLAAVRRDKKAVLKELGMCGCARAVRCASQSRPWLGTILRSQDKVVEDATRRA